MTRATPARGHGTSASRGGVILEYHRTSDVAPDPHGISVSPQRFAEHMEVISRRYAPTTLVGMSEALRGGRIAPNSVAVTFDDGYADNLLNAKPILESQGIPATFFVTVGYVEDQREFWWDELERCLLEATSLPARLELETGGRPYRRNLGDSRGVPSKTDASYWRWDLSVKKPPTPRHRAYRELHAKLRSLPPSRRERLLDELKSQAGLRREPAREEYRPLTPAELRELDRGDLAEVGAHGVTHSVLARLPLEDQGEEIEGGKARLERLLGRRVNLFSYPFGGKRDFTAKTARIVREAGFEAVCTSRQGKVVRTTDPLLLPRVFIYDWKGEEFERQMERFFGP
ncbi:MAG: polysaccharide deacetylase family protein [Thermoplasmata archaeon]